jgi:hypothetical protein
MEIGELRVIVAAILTVGVMSGLEAQERHTRDADEDERAKMASRLFEKCFAELLSNKTFADAASALKQAKIQPEN